ncbi:MAG: acetyl-CoA carboxylase biotin carboxyl carrier protein [Pseudomonadota bacterium]
MDLRKVKKLIELVEESGIAELEVSSGDESVRIARYPGATPAASVQTTTPQTSLAVPATDPVPVAGAGGEQRFVAPMAGTFYRAAHPDAAPFVEAGQRVESGDVLCIIESMKMMHEIRADAGGVIAQICVDNAQPVSTGDLLFKFS